MGKKPKTLTCSNCEKELSGDDEICVDNDGCTYCSRYCLLGSNLQEETTVQKYIDNMEPWE